MTALKRPLRVPLGAEVALAFGAGAASFAIVSVTVAAADSDVLVVVLAVVCVIAFGAMFQFWGVAYAVPAAVGGLVAYDWFQFAPTHPREFPDAADLAKLLGYLGLGVLLGELAAYAGRRAAAVEAARGELAEEQAALRRVATLVARGVPPDEVFAAVGEEVGALLGADGARVVRYEDCDEVLQLAGWSAPGHDPPPLGRLKLEGTSVTSEVLRTGRVARIDGYARVSRLIPARVHALAIRSNVGAPIVVDGRLWGAMLAWSYQRRPLAKKAESRLAGFTELVATAISNTASREQIAGLANEQAALRRVATLVAGGVPPPAVFAAVAEELGELLGVDATHIGRYEGDAAIGVGSWSRVGDHIPVGTRVRVKGTNVSSLVFQTGLPARVDSYDDAPGSTAEQLRRQVQVRSSVGAPIVVEGSLWGVMIASSKKDQPLPMDTESRIAAFTELVATAIANTEARVELGRLAGEQAALRRVATLAARGSSATEVFAAVTEEVGRLLGADSAFMHSYEPDGAAKVVASWGDLDTSDFPVGARLIVEGSTILAQVRRTRRPARIDDYADVTGSLGVALRKLGLRSAVGAPIVVDGRIWGVIMAGSQRAEPMPPDAESRIGEFTELVATAVSSIQARSELAASRARIMAAADAERRRVVRDLHDGAEQRLVHTVVTLNLAHEAVQEDTAEAAVLMTEALDHAERANAELRELAHGILPSVLALGGLRAGVEALASRMLMPVEVDVSAGRLPARVEATAYFVVAEALTNVTKHSHAAHAAVTAHVEDGVLRLQVRDDGVGGARSDGSGLQGLTDRLAVLDGQLRVKNPGDGGTLVSATIPIAPRNPG